MANSKRLEDIAIYEACVPNALGLPFPFVFYSGFKQLPGKVPNRTQAEKAGFIIIRECFTSGNRMYPYIFVHRDDIQKARAFAAKNLAAREGKHVEGVPEQWDVFIAHAGEDKEPFVRDLAHELSQRGVAVWFDETCLELGDSLKRVIETGLKKSNYGVVVLSKHFFKKEWPQRELDALFEKEISGKKAILPIWHNVTAKEVRHHSPLLAGRLAIRSDVGMDAVCEGILSVLKKKMA